MGKTFARAPETVMSRIRQLAEDFHKDDMFIEGGDKGSPPIRVTVEAFLVFGPRNKDGIQTGPALMVHGCPAAACIRGSKLEERVAGRADAIIHIDGDRVKHWPVATLMAVLDHELQHIELEKNAATGVPVLDDVGRPKIKMRPHDHDFGWFDVIAKRHGSAAVEVCQASVFAGEELRQLYFPGLETVVASKPVEEPDILSFSGRVLTRVGGRAPEEPGTKNEEPGTIEGVPKRKRKAAVKS